MTAGERAVWAAVYAASYIKRADGFSADGGADHAHTAACMASEAVQGLRHRVKQKTLPAVAIEHATAVLKGR